MYPTRFIVILSVLGLLFLAAGCGEQKQPDSQKQEAKTTTEDIKKEARDLVETARTYTMEQQQAYEQQLGQKLDEYARKVAALKAQVATMTGAAKEDMQDKIGSLHTKVEDMKNKAQELQAASGAAWDDLKEGLDKAEDDLEEAFNSAMQKFDK